MSDEERKAALDLLKTPDLLDRILIDFARCGLSGEESNVLTAYLAATSRKLDRRWASWSIVDRGRQIRTDGRRAGLHPERGQGTILGDDRAEPVSTWARPT